MARIDKYEMPDELYYTTDHAWVKVEGSRSLCQDFVGELPQNFL